MADSKADFLRCAREEWELGYSLTLAAIGCKAKQLGCDLGITIAYQADSGAQLFKAYKSLIKYLRPFEPHLTAGFLVDEAVFWTVGDIPVIPAWDWDGFGFPWLESQCKEATDATWKQALEDTERHARSWRKQFDALDFIFPPNNPIGSGRPGRPTSDLITRIGAFVSENKLKFAGCGLKDIREAWNQAYPAEPQSQRQFKNAIDAYNKRANRIK